MAHDLTINANGTAAFVSLRRSAWHGLGQVVTEEMDDATLLSKAGLDWHVEERPVYDGTPVVVGDDTLTTYDQIKGWKLLRRSDTKDDFAVVSNDFRVFQNREMVALMREIGGDAVRWETAGALGKKGQTTWAMAHLPDLSISLGKDDRTESYLLISNGHGNNRALVVMPTAVRVVCANTMRMAEGGKRNNEARVRNAANRDFGAAALAKGYGIHHDQGLDRAVADVASAYQRMLANRDATKVAYEMMATQAIADSDARGYWDRVLAEPVGQSETDRAKAMRMEREKRRRATMERLWVSDTNRTDATAGTVFGAFQAAVEYLDHEAPARSAQGRAFRAVMGTDVATKRFAWDEAIALCV
jgi:phage/plasmid-like protein (TIGR03299 family)